MRVLLVGLAIVACAGACVSSRRSVAAVGRGGRCDQAARRSAPALPCALRFSTPFAFISPTPTCSCRSASSSGSARDPQRRRRRRPRRFQRLRRPRVLRRARARCGRSSSRRSPRLTSRAVLGFRTWWWGATRPSGTAAGRGSRSASSSTREPRPSRAPRRARRPVCPSRTARASLCHPAFATATFATGSASRRPAAPILRGRRSSTAPRSSSALWTTAKVRPGRSPRALRPGSCS